MKTSTERMKKWRAKNRDSHLAKRRADYAENPAPLIAKSSEWNRSHREQQAKQARKYRVGVTPEQYEQMFQAQNGCCAICGKPELVKHQSGKLKSLAVDHDHETEKVRGLLCSLCNRGIGMFFDDPKLLMNAIQYLIRASEANWEVT